MPTYNYSCKNEDCDLAGFQANKKMSEYKDPQPCPNCGTLCQRMTGDWCRNFKLVGHGWYAGGYNGASNGVASYKDELRKAGKDPHRHPEDRS